MGCSSEITPPRRCTFASVQVRCTVLAGDSVQAGYLRASGPFCVSTFLASVKSDAYRINSLAETVKGGAFFCRQIGDIWLYRAKLTPFSEGFGCCRWGAHFIAEMWFIAVELATLPRAPAHFTVGVLYFGRNFSISRHRHTATWRLARPPEESSSCLRNLPIYLQRKIPPSIGR